MNILKFKKFINESKYSTLSKIELYDIFDDALDKNDAELLNDISDEISRRDKDDEKPMSKIDKINHEISKKFSLGTH